MSSKTTGRVVVKPPLWHIAAVTAMSRLHDSQFLCTQTRKLVPKRAESRILTDVLGADYHVIMSVFAVLNLLAICFCYCTPGFERSVSIDIQFLLADYSR